MKKWFLNTAPILYFIVSLVVIGFIAFGLQMIFGIQVMKFAINVLLVFGFFICIGGTIAVDIWRKNKIEKNK